jgi:hypothetical protein
MLENFAAVIRRGCVSGSFRQLSTLGENSPGIGDPPELRIELTQKQ